MINKLKLKYYYFIFTLTGRLSDRLNGCSSSFSYKHYLLQKEFLKFKNNIDLNTCKNVVEESFCANTPFELVVHDKKSKIKVC